jgi:hypothetical protein
MTSSRSFWQSIIGSGVTLKRPHRNSGKPLRHTWYQRPIARLGRFLFYALASQFKSEKPTHGRLLFRAALQQKLEDPRATTANASTWLEAPSGPHRFDERDQLISFSNLSTRSVPQIEISEAPPPALILQAAQAKPSQHPNFL